MLRIVKNTQGHIISPKKNKNLQFNVRFGLLGRKDFFGLSQMTISMNITNLHETPSIELTDLHQKIHAAQR